jgi:hypothetical protein
MPGPTEILAGLTEIANRGIAVAVAWHVAIAVALVALARGWRPSQRMAGALIGMPLTSVAAFALVFGNPFNGMVFTLGALVVVALAMMADERPVSRGPALTSAVGVASIAFAWVYPHFLEGHPAWYLVAAPVGLVPCPTLAVVMGFALLGGGLGVRAWTLTLAALGLSYGLIGVLWLGVLLDIGLMVGAIVLVAVALRARRAGPASVQRSQRVHDGL